MFQMWTYDGAWRVPVLWQDSEIKEAPFRHYYLWPLRRERRSRVLERYVSCMQGQRQSPGIGGAWNGRQGNWWGMFFLTDLGLVIDLLAVVVSYPVTLIAWNHFIKRKNHD